MKMHYQMIWLLVVLAGSCRASLCAQTIDRDFIPAWVGRAAEPFDVKEHLKSRLATADNAADLYQPAFATFDRPLGGEAGRALGKAVEYFAQIDKLASGEVPREEVKQVLSEAASAIELIDTAQAKSHCVFEVRPCVDAPYAFSQPVRTVVRLSVLQLYQTQATGDFAAAEAAIKRGLRVSRDVQPLGGMVSQLTSTGVDIFLLSAIERFTLRDPRLSVEQCERLLSLLLEHQQKSLNRVDEGIKAEYLSARNTIADMQSGRLAFEKLFGPIQNPNVASLPKPNYVKEIATCNRLFGLALQEARRSGPHGDSAIPQEIAKLQAEAKVAAANLQATGEIDAAMLMLMLSPAFEMLDASNRIADAHLAGLQMLIALKRYELQHGNVPPALETAAAEAMLPAIPVDPYSGMPLKFALVEGKPTIYSIGKDQKDDGGKIDWQHGTKPGDMLFVLPQGR